MEHDGKHDSGTTFTECVAALDFKNKKHRDTDM